MAKPALCMSDDELKAYIAEVNLNIIEQRVNTKCCLHFNSIAKNCAEYTAGSEQAAQDYSQTYATALLPFQRAYEADAKDVYNRSLAADYEEAEKRIVVPYGEERCTDVVKSWAYLINSSTFHKIIDVAVGQDFPEQRQRMPLCAER